MDDENVLIMTDAFQSLPKQYQQKISQRRPWHEYWLSVGFICLGCQGKFTLTKVDVLRAELSRNCVKLIALSKLTQYHIGHKEMVNARDSIGQCMTYCEPFLLKRSIIGQKLCLLTTLQNISLPDILHMFLCLERSLSWQLISFWGRIILILLENLG